LQSDAIEAGALGYPANAPTMNSLLRSVAAWLCAAALLLPCTAFPAQKAKPAPQWQAVLAAGDNAQPVFDNATEALGRFLTARGVQPADIHRLSAGDAGAEPSSADRLLARVASLPARPRERCLIFITSHGREDEGVWLAYEREYLQPNALAQALSGGCARVPTVVIVSACFSGSFAEGGMRAPNRIILTAARPDRPSFGCQADRIYTFFDECLIMALPRAPTWRAVFAETAACVGRLERKLRARPSEPRAFFGSAVRDLPVP
jgi:Peptidase C13 family